MRFPYRGAGIGLVMDNRLLLGKRSDHPFYGSWAVPGGGREKNDRDELANAIRELKEETSIDFSKLDAKPICHWTLKFPFFRWTTYYYAIESFSQNLKADEFSELEWVGLDDIKKRHLRPFLGAEVRFLKSHL